MLLSILVQVLPVLALGNGLERTPGMGWNSWNQVRCYGLNENVVKAAADAIVSRGLHAKGYEYVVVDDCWQNLQRNPDGSLQANATRFPSGIKAVADYVHSKGLKFGLYGSPGTQTCAMRYDAYPGVGLGSKGHEQQDANTFAAWGVDFVKYDWCAAEQDGLTRIPAFTAMRDAIAKTGRPMTYSISEYGHEQPWLWATPIANSWRTTNDIQANWGSIAQIIQNQASLYPYSSPGAWNDPDMLQIGNGKLTAAETRSHMAMWCFLASPLKIGTDIAKLSAETLAVLANPRIIAIDQDRLGKQARRIQNDGSGVQLWLRPITTGQAFAVFNTASTTKKVTVTVPVTSGVVDGWSGSAVALVNKSFTITVAPHDTLFYTYPQTAGSTDPEPKFVLS